MLNTIFRFLISRHLQAVLLFLAVFSLAGLSNVAPDRIKPVPCFIWCVSPAGDLFAGWDGKSTVSVYETNTSQEIASFVHSAPTKLCPRLFSPNSQYLTTTFETTSPEGRPSFPIYVWNIKVPQTKPIIISGDGGIQNFAFSPDSTKLIVIDDHRTYQGEKPKYSLSIWNIDTGERATVLDAAHQDKIDNVEWSPDGSKVATSSKDGTVRLWDVRSLSAIKSLRSLAVNERYIRAAFSSQGGILVGLTMQGDIFCWDIESGALKSSHKLDGYLKYYPHNSGYDVLSRRYAHLWAANFLKNNEQWLPRWAQRWLYKRNYCVDLYKFQPETGSLGKQMALPAAYGDLMVVPDSKEIMIFDVDDHQLTWFKLNQLPVWLWPFIWAIAISLSYWLLLSFLARRKRTKQEHPSQPNEVGLKTLTSDSSAQEGEGGNIPTP